MSSKPESFSIKNWSQDDQPREKLLNKGKRALSNAELVCILLAFGTKGVSALEVAKNILMMFDKIGDNRQVPQLKSVKRIKFRKPVLPGDRMVVEVDYVSLEGGELTVKARVGVPFVCAYLILR